MLARLASLLTKPAVFYGCTAVWAAMGVVSLFYQPAVFGSLFGVISLIYGHLILVAGNAQAEAGQAKADEMLRAVSGARNELIGLDREPIEKIEEVRAELDGEKVHPTTRVDIEEIRRNSVLLSDRQTYDGVPWDTY